MKTRKKCRSPMCKIEMRRGYPAFTQLITHGKYITMTGICQTEVSHG